MIPHATLLFVLALASATLGGLIGTETSSGRGASLLVVIVCMLIDLWYTEDLRLRLGRSDAGLLHWSSRWGSETSELSQTLSELVAQLEILYDLPADGTLLMRAARVLARLERR